MVTFGSSDRHIDELDELDTPVRPDAKSTAANARVNHDTSKVKSSVRGLLRNKRTNRDPLKRGSLGGANI